MNKIAVYYIATNKYIVLFDEFISGLKYFFPNVKKKVVLITDCDDIDFKEKRTDEIEIVQNHIDHYYWPINALFKMFYIDKFFADDCDYHFYFNANLKFTKVFEINDDFDMCINQHFYSDRLSFYAINNGNNNNCVVPPSWAKCHISQREIPSNAKYCQDCFFGGKTESIKHMLTDVNIMIKDDLNHHIIPLWQDETYFNKYLLKFFWNENIIGTVNIVSIYDYATLLNKDDYFDKFNL